MVLLLLTVLEFLIARRPPPGGLEGYMGKKEGIPGPRNGLLATTISNPGFRDDPSRRLTTNGISVTDSSVRFVLSPSRVPAPTLSRLELARELSKRAQQRRSPSKNVILLPMALNHPHILSRNLNLMFLNGILAV